MKPKDNWKKTHTILKQDHVSSNFCIRIEYIEFSQTKKNIDIYLCILFLQSQTNEFIIIRINGTAKILHIISLWHLGL